VLGGVLALGLTGLAPSSGDARAGLVVQLLFHGREIVVPVGVPGRHPKTQSPF